MDAAAASASSPGIAGPSNGGEMAPPVAFEEDGRYGHFATTASQVPKPLMRMSPPPLALGSPVEGNSKDVKSFGTRFHEDCHETESTNGRPRSGRALEGKGKGKEAQPAEREKSKPLHLLDLPLDILKDIVKEVTHTNDLTSLALCHSALHRLAIPHIYSRFDIVWPDTNTHAEPRSGVDALTYGLATLVMAEEIFGEPPSQQANTTNRYNASGCGRATETTVRRRRGNHYAQFTRKFSLGNGPADWVLEYLITKEGGKMLGTLVALAVARMRALETFIWDMPTGILRDVWLALSSLGDRDGGKSCRLEKLWVRWHNNSVIEHIPPPPPPMNLNVVPPATLQPSHALTASSPTQHQIHPAALDRVEHPSFSVLPPLKSLSVLDIDELAYLDEMAVLIGKSLDKLRELRVGIAAHVIKPAREWVTVWEGDNIQQVDPDHPTAGSLTIGEKRLGGVLGTLTGFVCDIRKPSIVLTDRTKRRAQTTASAKLPTVEAIPSSPADQDTEGAAPPSDALMEQSSSLSGFTSLQDILPDEAANAPFIEPVASSPHTMLSADPRYDSDPLIATSSSSHASSPMFMPTVPVPPESVHDLPEVAVPIQTLEDGMRSEDALESEQRYLDNKLCLQSLELERVPISVPVLQKAIDWTRLTSLTLLHCQNHEQLWKTLRRTFAPTPKSPIYPHPRRTPTSTPKKGGKAPLVSRDAELQYSLKLKKIHTNTASPALISFLKETLAPNSLEVLFLQEARSYSSSVTVDQIYKGPIRRHRNSLRKILIDSSEKGVRPDGIPTSSSRWRRWMLSREILGFVCSGKMPSLRELGMAIDYRDWHFFLQHLPAIPHLRSLYIPFLADHVHGTNVDPRELALQIVDIVALRPEVELCYMGIANKCFEILENRRDCDGRGGDPLGPGGASADDGPGSDGDDDDDDDEPDAAEDEDGADDGDDADNAAGADDSGSDNDDDDVDEDDDDDDDDASSTSDFGEDGRGAKNAAHLRLREILFYDDKVAIFKARHGRL